MVDVPAKRPDQAKIDKAKNDIRALVAKGASREKIDEYLAIEGLTKFDINPNIPEDVQNLAPEALRTGVEAVPGGPGEMSKLAPDAVRWLLTKLGADEETLQEYDASRKGEGGIPYVTPAISAITENLPDMGTVQKYITDPLLGKHENYEPRTSTGEVVQTGIENIPSTLLSPGSLVSKTVDLVASTGGEEGAAALAKRYLPGYETLARLIGGGTGSAAGAPAINQLSNPRPIPPQRQPHIDTLRTENVPVSAGQLSGNERLMRQELMAGDTPAHLEQGEAFTAAAARRQGGFPEGTRRLDRATMDAELTRMGDEFNRLSAGTSTPFDQSLMNDLVDVTEDYIAVNPHVAPIVEQTVNELFDNAMANNGTLSGDSYQAQRSRIGEIIRDENTDPGVRGALIAMQDRLDEAVARNLSPEQQAAWRTVRAQYRNFMPLESAMAAPGANTASGELNAKQLQAGIKANLGKRARAAGRNDFQDLADAGEVVLQKPSSSGTAENLRAQLARMASLGIGTASGGMSLLFGADPATAVAIGGGTQAAASAYPAARDAFIRSPAGQAILSRQGPTIDQGGPTRVAGGGPLGGDVQMSPEMARAFLAAMRAEAMRDRSDERQR